jgi:hypothetical protein
MANLMTRIGFIDETSLKTKMVKTTGWAPKGERLVDHAPFGSWQTQTPDQLRGKLFIAALRHDRLDAPWVINGPINRDLFDTCVETQLAPTLQKGDAIILDNLSVRKSPKGVVGRCVRPALGFDHAGIGEHQGCRLGLHRCTTIGMQRQLVGRDCMFCHGVFDERLELAGTFRMLDAPAGDAVPEDVENDAEIEAGPFHRPHVHRTHVHRPHEFCDVPGPHVIGALGQQFRPLVDRVATLTAALCDLAMGGKDAIHRSDLTPIHAFIEQGGIDLGRGLVGEAGSTNFSKHMIPFTFRTGACDR